MQNDLIYSGFFSNEREFVANIPLHDNKTLQQRCVINSIIDDVADIGFTGEELPEWHLIVIGILLELRGFSQNGSFGCRSIIIDCNIVGHYLIRLIGSVYMGELREFQRLDVYVPCRYTIVHADSLDELTDIWLKKRSDSNNSTWLARDPNSWMDFSAENQSDDSVPLIANVTRDDAYIETFETVSNKSYLYIQFLLPFEEPLLTQSIGRVDSEEIYAKYESGKICYKVHIQYSLIKSGDRDCIDRYVSSLQMQHMGEICKDAQYEALYNKLKNESEYKDPLLYFKKAFAVILFLILSTLLFNSANKYRKGHEKGLIERAFEDGIRKYQEKFK